MKRAFAFSFVIAIATAGAVGLKAFIHGSRALEADLHHRIDHRAQLDLFEDFQMGLDFWEGRQPIGRTWSYDASGLVIPGELSFFKPSMQLTDYDVEIWAEIVNKGFGLVFRGAGPRSYHALEFMAQGSGATASIAGERYTVIDGKTSTRYVCYPWSDSSREGPTLSHSAASARRFLHSLCRSTPRRLLVGRAAEVGRRRVILRARRACEDRVDANLSSDGSDR
jgi:hypothetical protein